MSEAMKYDAVIVSGSGWAILDVPFQYMILPASLFYVRIGA